MLEITCEIKALLVINYIQYCLINQSIQSSFTLHQCAPV